MSFADTRWSMVLAARDTRNGVAAAALSDLCAAYYQPVSAFLRCEGRNEEAARELAHDFFARLLAGGIGNADPQRGRFRSFLLGALKHFLADRRDHHARLKRGGGAEHTELDSAGDTATWCGPQTADEKALPPDVMFDRQWAMAVLDRALLAVGAQMNAEGKAAVFAALKPWLAGTADRGEQQQAAEALGLTENALRVAVHRLRQRFRDALRTELAHTLAPGMEADEELLLLRAALAGER